LRRWLQQHHPERGDVKPDRARALQPGLVFLKRGSEDGGMDDAKGVESDSAFICVFVYV